jgi:uncharacterized membrane protein
MSDDAPAPPDQPRAHEVRWGIPKNRIEALADGLFAIVLTLLVLELAIPEDSGRDLAGALWEIAPKFGSYVFSFVVLGIYWIAHHHQLYNVRHVDRGYMWATLFFLLAVTFVPFATGVAGSYPLEPVSLTLYGASLIAVGATMAVALRHASRQGLLREDMDPFIVRSAYRRSLVAPACYVLAIAAAWVDPWISIAIFVIVPVIYLMPARFDIFYRLNDRDRRRAAARGSRG